MTTSIISRDILTQKYQVLGMTVVPSMSGALQVMIVEANLSMAMKASKEDGVEVTILIKVHPSTKEVRQSTDMKEEKGSEVGAETVRIKKPSQQVTEKEEGSLDMNMKGDMINEAAADTRVEKPDPN